MRLFNRKEDGGKLYKSKQSVSIIKCVFDILRYSIAAVLSLLALSGCGITSFQRNPVVDEHVSFSLNKDASEILIYRRNGARGQISVPNVYKIQGNYLIFDRVINIPNGTTSIAFDYSNKNYLITQFADNQHTLSKINSNGDVVSRIYSSRDPLFADGELANGEYLAIKSSEENEFLVYLIIIKNKEIRGELKLVTNGFNVIRDSVFDMTFNNLVYGKYFKMPIPPSSRYASNFCSGDAEVTCFQVMMDAVKYGDVKRQTSHISIASTLGNCQSSDSIQNPIQIRVGRDGKTIIYTAVANLSNGDRSFFINHNPGKECVFSKMEVKGGN